jgi:hypothetical protein
MPGCGNSSCDCGGTCECAQGSCTCGKCTLTFYTLSASFGRGVALSGKGKGKGNACMLTTALEIVIRGKGEKNNAPLRSDDEFHVRFATLSLTNATHKPNDNNPFDGNTHFAQLALHGTETRQAKIGGTASSSSNGNVK